MRFQTIFTLAFAAFALARDDDPASSDAAGDTAVSGVWSARTRGWPTAIACVGGRWGNWGHWDSLAAELLSVEFVGICELGDFAGSCWEGVSGEVWMLQCIHGVDAFPPV